MAWWGASDSCVIRGLEAVPVPPGHRLCSGLDADLAVGRPDVGLHGVDAEKGPARYLVVGEAARDERQHLRCALRQPQVLPGPAQNRFGSVLDDWPVSVLVDCNDPGDQLICAEAFVQV